MSKLETKMEAITTIYAETIEGLNHKQCQDEDQVVNSKQEFESYWATQDGEHTVTLEYELLQNLEMRLTELAVQKMRVSFSDEYENLERQQGHTQSSSIAPINSPFATFSNNSIFQGIPSHWYKRGHRIPDFDENPTSTKSSKRFGKSFQN